jgi:phenylpropionate dioxygenase-like ring-hydroxylating dioxygenase large terminal subunit
MPLLRRRTKFELPAPRPLIGPLRSLESAQTSLRRLPDRRLLATIRHAPLRGVTPEMLAWWFRNIEGTVSVEGRDYRLETLMPFWQCTSEQDWRICEDQQRGVSSSRYVPGPYAKNLEANVAHFVDWYLGEMLPRRAPLKAVSA